MRKLGLRRKNIQSKVREVLTIDCNQIPNLPGSVLSPGHHIAHSLLCAGRNSAEVDFYFRGPQHANYFLFRCAGCNPLGKMPESNQVPISDCDDHFSSVSFLIAGPWPREVLKKAWVDKAKDASTPCREGRCHSYPRHPRRLEQTSEVS